VAQRTIVLLAPIYEANSPRFAPAAWRPPSSRSPVRVLFRSRHCRSVCRC